MTEYEPGVCNIDEEGQRKRYILGASGLVSGLLLASANFLTSVSDLIFVGVAVLLFIGFEGTLQGYKSFCVAHASKGTYQTEEGEEQKIEDEEDRKKDMDASKKLHLQAALLTIVATAILYAAQLQI